MHDLQPTNKVMMRICVLAFLSHLNEIFFLFKTLIESKMIRSIHFQWWEIIFCFTADDMQCVHVKLMKRILLIFFIQLYMYSDTLIGNDMVQCRCNKLDYYSLCELYGIKKKKEYVTFSAIALHWVLRWIEYEIKTF